MLNLFELVFDKCANRIDKAQKNVVKQDLFVP